MGKPTPPEAAETPKLHKVNPDDFKRKKKAGKDAKKVKALAQLKIDLLEAKKDKTKAEVAILKALKEKHKL